MTDSISRAFVSDIEVRAAGDGRTVAGIVVPFDRTAVVSDGGPSYREAFQRGAFTKTIAERGDRVKLLSHHNSRTNPLGRATMLREDAAGLYGEFRVAATQAGDEALELLRDGALDSFSVGFAPRQHVKRDGVTWRTEVALREASLVTFPAYEDARVETVRAFLAAAYSPEDLLRMIAEATDIRSTTPAREPEGVDTSTPVEAVRADEEPALVASLRTATQKRLAFQRALIERGIRNV